jgi:hypothetical protein
MAINFLTEGQFGENAAKHSASHWTNAKDRWRYHKKAIELLQEIGPQNPSDVLELGTMGASLVNGSDTMDFNSKWMERGYAPTIFHDARNIPWPIEDNRYQVLVALRVYQHLVPSQKEAFKEARRIARNVIIVVPDKYPTTIMGDRSAGAISPEDFTSWNGGVPPTRYTPFGNWIGGLYFWGENCGGDTKRSDGQEASS